MRYRQLGTSDLQASEISLGSWLTFSGGIEFDQTRACTAAALDAGINFFDTANAYGQGSAESAWGEILSAHPRATYVLATKLFAPMSEDPADFGLSAAQIHKQLDASLQRLRTDYIDLYQAHRFDINVPLEETVEAFQDVVRSGKARYIGFSEWTPKQIRAAVEIGGEGLFVSSQPQYSMLWRGPEAEVFELCASRGVSQIVWSPLAQGVLTGKYKPGQEVPADSRFASPTMGIARGRYNDDVLDAVQQLVPIAADAGLNLATMALAWVLRRPEVASAITGASRPEQVYANAAASGVSLDEGILARIDSVLGAVAVTQPKLAVGAVEGVLRR
ncbi:aldo/keto reductase family protein [Mycobacterium sp. 134]|uniref:aldo/keto reductase family protein n=1 Tax=Mycobacterium sp. 134 TaxID=3400425 RepID=UPI003AAF4CDD